MGEVEVAEVETEDDEVRAPSVDVVLVVLVVVVVVGGMSAQPARDATAIKRAAAAGMIILRMG